MHLSKLKKCEEVHETGLRPFGHALAYMYSMPDLSAKQTQLNTQDMT